MDSPAPETAGDAMTDRYIRDISSNDTICGETLIYTAGCLDEKTGIQFLGCTLTFSDDEAEADWHRVFVPDAVSSVDFKQETP